MNREFDYISHYKKDAEEFDYFQERPAGTEHDERRVREMIISRLPKGLRNILDVGSGSAWVARKLVPKGVGVTSLDISKHNVKKAVELVPAPEHTGIVSDSFNLPFADNSFGCVISSEVIEHVPDPKKFVAELFRVVTPGGVLIITTPYKEKLQYYLCVHCNKMTPVHSHINSFDENRLKEVYENPDLEFFEFKTFGNKLLLYIRSHVILKYLPFRLWFFLDSLANKIYSNPVHIIAIFRKK